MQVGGLMSHIDVIIPWVDGNDIAWRREKKIYDLYDNVSKIRYESWDCLQYVFRGIEKNLPWVNRIFFVTWGHLPEWINDKNPRLRIIRHEDYIPGKYLPTFNSNTIEMNYFRIAELSEQFILFNDDFYPLSFLPEEYFFKDGMPCGESIETHFVLKGIGDADLQIAYAQVNNSVILNDHFDKREVTKKYHDKWFNFALGNRVEQNEALSYWHNFESFVFPHEAMPMLKSTLATIWKVDRASGNKFRAASDVTQRLISQWQFCTGNFVPRKSLGHVYHANDKDIDLIVNEVIQKKYPIVCINEDEGQNFDLMKEKVQYALQKVLPEKSLFEI